METRSKKNSRIMPLPGDRQGMSGADAGCDSGRAIGGRLLNRRAPIRSPEQTTAEDSLNSIKYQKTVQDSQQDNTDKDVAQVIIPQPTLTDQLNKQRTTWTTDMNQYVVRCFYTITKLETIKRPYGVELHRLVTNRYPELRNKTIQNILDQRRSAFKNNRLSAETINHIREEVAVELGMQGKRTSDKEILEADTHEVMVDTPTEAESEFERQHILYNGLEPTLKPQLPKLVFKSNTQKILQEMDSLIAQKLYQDITIEEIHSLIYTGAITTIILNEQNINHFNRRIKVNQPPWERRLCYKINILRKNIGILTQYQRPQPSEKVIKVAKTLMTRYKSEINQTIIEVSDYLRQTLSALAKRLKRYRKSNKRRQQNSQFQTNQRAFYKELELPVNNKVEENKNEMPKGEILRQYWSGIWSTPINFKKTKWYYEEKEKAVNIKTMLDWRITKADFLEALKKTHNWKAPGPDKLHNFWYKRFTSTHDRLVQCYNTLLDNPEITPSFMTVGTTYLISKTANLTADPAKYRPITCLPTIYKLLTSIISRKIYGHLEINQLLDEEQKGCRKGSRGCKEQLIIDTVITSDAKERNKSLFTAYIDYQKAFDSLPHSWLMEVLKLYRVENHIISFLAYTMLYWRTDLVLNTMDQTIQIGNIKIKRGIFQGDALSPLWFCLALRPLTTMLHRQRRGYLIGNTNVEISHLWYMDDLKLFASKKEDLNKLLDCVGKFSTDIKMKFGLDKCKLNSMVKGKWVQHAGYEVDEWQGVVIGMEEQERYKYLGYLQAQGIDHKAAKEVVTNTYLQRIRSILKSELSAKNTTMAINIYAVSVLTYTFGILNWTDTELAAFDISTRKEFRRHRAHHPHSAVERFHLARSQGGRGVLSIPSLHYRQVLNLRKYFHSKVMTSTLHAAVVRVDQKCTPLHLAKKNYDVSSKIPSVEQLKNQWKSKPLHGKYISIIEKENIDTSASQEWLRVGSLFVETEGFVAAIQDQVIPTRSYRHRIMREIMGSVKCRICNEKEETIDHLIDSCTMLAPKQYLERHNNVAKIIHQKVAVKHGFSINMQPYYAYAPSSVLENDQARIYWNRQIITDRPIPNNIPDIVVTLKMEKITYLIDVAIPLAANINKKYAEKINKYLPLADEIKSMWGMNSVQIVPIIVGSTGEIPVKLHENLKLLQLNSKLYISIQKSVLLDTCSVVRRVLGDGNWT